MPDLSGAAPQQWLKLMEPLIYLCFGPPVKIFCTIVLMLPVLEWILSDKPLLSAGSEFVTDIVWVSSILGAGNMLLYFFT